MNPPLNASLNDTLKPEHPDWSFENLERYDKHIQAVAKEFKLDTYPNQIEIISAEQMMDNYSSIGMPLGYHHWSFGKQYLNVEKQYKRGHMGLAYELVINSNPCIAYLMEENSLAMQILVIAHACYGHNSFFKNNYLFKAWTSADAIIDYLVFAKSYVTQCEQQYGNEAVEEILDAAHALMNQGVDRYRRPAKLSIYEEKARQLKRKEYLQTQVNELWKTIPKKQSLNKDDKDRFPKEPEENILYFLEKHAPLLEPWQREIIRIVRKISQYFYPQKQTKVMNEGWATFWHYQILQTLYERNIIDDPLMVEFLHNHTNVITQFSFEHPGFNGINPYTLGFNIFQDIKRLSTNPTDEDQEWFGDLIHKDWLENIHFAMRDFKDESFIAQFLSPHVIRKMKLFTLLDDETKNELEITHIHNTDGYQKVRELLSKQYNLSYCEPNIQVYDVDHKGDRSMTLRHYMQDRRPLNSEANEVLKHLHRLWGFPVKLESVDEPGKVTQTLHCPPLSPPPEVTSSENPSDKPFSTKKLN